MGTTIQLDETLAAQLRCEASARRLSIEELSHRLLTEAVQRIEVSSRWGARNQRRIELIRKSTSVELTPEEQAELDELQAELHQRLEATDQQLLNGLIDLENAVLPEIFALLERNQIMVEAVDLFCYPSQPRGRRHGPRGYASYQQYKPWLRPTTYHNSPTAGAFLKYSCPPGSWQPHDLKA